METNLQGGREGGREAGGKGRERREGKNERKKERGRKGDRKEGEKKSAFCSLRASYGSCTEVVLAERSLLHGRKQLRVALGDLPSIPHTPCPSLHLLVIPFQDP